MKKVLMLLAAAALVGGVYAPMQVRAATSSLTDIQSGDLVRGQSFSAVYYYGKDGFRYVFPNDKTYFTWYSNFDSVKWLTDADLATIQIGGNVTYKPGSRMVKINSDPKTYAVDEGGSLRWITSEAVAVASYGSAWNTMIDDVPDAFFSNYDMGSDIEAADDYSATEAAASASSINNDKDLQAATVIRIQDMAFSSATVTIDAGTAVRFINDDDTKHNATADDESWGTGTLTEGQSFSRYFDEAGTYTYHCTYHPDMVATIVVTD